MATKAAEKTVFLAGEESPLPNNLPELQGDIPAEVALDNVLNTLESDQTEAKVWIWRANPEHLGKGKGRDTYVAEMSPMDFQEYGLAGIQAEHGAGIYRVKIHAENGTLLLNRLFEIEPLTPRKKREYEMRQRQELGQVPQQQQGGDLMQGFAMLAKSMQDGFNNLAQLMIRQQNDRRGLVEELAMYKNLFTPPTNGGAVADPFGMMKSALDLVKELGAGKTGETTTADVFLKLTEQAMPALVEIAKGQAMRQAVAVRPASAPSIPQLAAAAAVPEMTEENPMSIVLRMYLPMFIQQARAGNDAYTYANMILDHVPEPTVREFIARPDLIEYLAGFDPAVREPQIAQWFAQLRALLEQLLTEEQNESTNASSVGISTGSLQ